MLNVYAHVTDEMRQKAADCIDRGIAGAEPSSKHAESKPGSSTFQAVKGKYRKPGTGCVTQINDHLWEAAIPPRSTENASPGISTPLPKKNVRKSWRS